ncbi:hypothetical protein TNCT_118001 [Trichonephila clavata]|uniref:Uncharacterized protein n=1 Tax=Trichonephila clavata TaxID=2740835 RepID=A0A8X6LTW9_TRICU|nr:hypothetical protein TNCT_118001 [Trichonephila clavata]
MPLEKSLLSVPKIDSFSSFVRRNVKGHVISCRTKENESSFLWCFGALWMNNIDRFFLWVRYLNESYEQRIKKSLEENLSPNGDA